jgi:hypothetical protein
VFGTLTEIERRRFLAEVIAIDYIVAWGASALDSQPRQIADAAFNAIAAVNERLRHDEMVRAWIEQHERSERKPSGLSRPAPPSTA